MSSSRARQLIDSSAGQRQCMRYNPPGRRAIEYSGARYLDAVLRMLNRLPTQTIADCAAGPPLAALNQDIHDDWAIALIHAWAVVADVLTFYQERITNEGYLRTATEYRSVLELARTIGYELGPGLAAGTHLAFTVLTMRDEPPRQVFIPQGCAVQSVPGQNQLPQTFETSADFNARAEWNALRPTLALGSPPRDLGRRAASIRLAGASTGLRLNDVVLIVDDDPNLVGPDRPWLLATITAVKPDPQRGYTTIIWDGAAAAPIRAPRIYTLLPPAALLAYTQGGVYYAAGAQPRWAPAAIGLPKAAAHALATTAAGQLFAGTEKDLFRSVDRGASWQPMNVALVQKDYRALAVDDEGNVYAGAKDGSIYMSKDQGDNWATMSGDGPPPPASRLALPGSSSGPMPKTVVRALAAYTDGGQATLAAGTDDGVLRSTDRGKTWDPANTDLPKTDPKTGLTPTIAWSLAIAKQGKNSALFAGTDAGVFHIQGQTSTPVVAATIPSAGLLAGWLLKDPAKGPLDKLIETGSELLKSGGALLAGALDLVAPWLQPFADLLKPLGDLKDYVTSVIAKIIGFATSGIQWLVGLIVGLPIVGPLLKTYFVPAINVLIITALAVAALLAARRLANRFLDGKPTVSLGMPVHALVAAKSGQLFAGTEKGIFRSNDGEQPQGSRARQIWRRVVTSAQGDLARRWKPANTGLAGLDVRALAIDDQGALLAGTQDGLVFRSTDNGDTWSAAGDSLTLKSVLALLPVAGGAYAAGTPLDRGAEAAWSIETLQNRQIDLDRAYPDIAAGTWVVLRQEGAPAMLYRAQTVVLADSQVAARPGQFTRITVDTAEGLAGFDRRVAMLLAQSVPLPLYDDSPVQSDTLTFDTFVPGLELGHTLIVSGKRIRARLAPHVAPGAVRLRSPDGLLSPVVQPGELLQVMAPPRTAADGTHRTWKLRSRAGIVGTVDDAAADVIWEPANDDDETVSEVATIELVSSDAERTTVSLQAPLANLYDRSTVTIYGNVVHATHGQTVANELLGSSDSMSTNQQFLLKQPPLTYLPAASAGGIASTLTVKVNGVRWEEVPFLHRRARNRRAYMLRQDAASGPPAPAQGGRAGAVASLPTFPSLAVIFGDGTYGAGLPTGTWKIEATYRSGLGSMGNLAAGSLSVLQTALRGITGVTNPVAATGGNDPERMDHARQQAPLTVRAMQRIVSLTDYQDFARTFAGIGKAQASLIARGHSRLLHLTVGDTAGNVIEKTSDLYVNLKDDIDRYRAAPTPPAYIDSFEPRYFNVRARVLIEPSQRDRRDALEADIRQALVEAFSYAQRDFGRSVAEAEVINVIQRITGVVAVDLVWLHIHDEEALRRPLLEALPARWSDNRLWPAQLLLINTIAKDGILLELNP